MRFPAAFLYDIKIQFRHGLYAVYTLVSLFYIIALHQIPEQYREIAGIFITFSDPGVLGFFFIGGLVLLERNQNILDNLFITPYKVEEYIFSKALSLTVLSILTSYIIQYQCFWYVSLSGAVSGRCVFNIHVFYHFWFRGSGALPYAKWILSPVLYLQPDLFTSVTRNNRDGPFSFYAFANKRCSSFDQLRISFNYYVGGNIFCGNAINLGCHRIYLGKEIFLYHDYT
ncbi:hypothetical protein BN988_03473 [Oceanobacillus picturae]|uniref:Uncharacterized protein n=1 Tax=Oceanobacillus picturae TaxID=171693 RepID=W9AQJ7_9BACI|nr:hypothetical protein [Oceanobacillus picturae]CDO04896.1 hypothetical protein BN988_03473 [Oceanobacillus picturae]